MSTSARQEPGWQLAWQFARRDVRGGLKGLRLLVACLVLGVAAIAGVGSLSQSISQSLAEKGQVLLGADIELRLTHRSVTASQLAWLQTLGTVSQTAEMTAMVRVPATQQSQLGALKAVDGGYPLYGDFQLAGGQQLQAALPGSGVVLDPLLAERIGVGPGQQVRIGEAEFTVRGLIKAEPDRAGEGFAYGPSVLIGLADLPATGLIQPGALVRYHYRIKLPAGAAVGPVVAQIKARYPQEDWRVQDRSNGAPGVRRFVDQLGQFLTLVGLTALMVSGLGVANAVNAHLERKIGTIATLKALGASSGLIFRIWLLEILLVASIAIAVGVVLGALVPVVGAQLLATRLPVPPQPGLYPVALAQAAAFGVLIALAATVWPLARARETSAARLFRARIAGLDRRPQTRFLVVIGAALAAAVALGVLGSSEKLLALGVIAGCAGLLGLLRLLAWGVAAVARRLPPSRQPLMRLALANLHRPGAPAATVITALGLGLSLFATLAVVQANLTAQVTKSLPARAPAYFVIDVPPDQIAAFRQTVAAVPGIGELVTVPSLRGPLVAINGTPAAQFKPVDPGKAWVLRGDRGLTYTATLPPDNVITAGRWWPPGYAGPPLVSFDAEQAAALGIGVGDSVTVSVLGVQVTARIASLRQIDWSSLGFNFVILFAPGTLEGAPHTFMATVQADGPAEAAVYRAITRQFPTVSVVRVKDVLGQVSTLLTQVNTAVQATALVTVLSGILVLVGAMATVQAARSYDGVILKMLGASRGQVLCSYLAEYALLGLVSGVIAVAAGAAAGWFVVAKVLSLPWVLPWPALGATVLGGAAITLLFSLGGAFAVLRTRPNAALRALV